MAEWKRKGNVVMKNTIKRFVSMIMVAVLGFSMSALALNEEVQEIGANDLQVLIDTNIGDDTYNVTEIGGTKIYS